MTRKELIKELEKLVHPRVWPRNYYPEHDHLAADKLLLKYIDDQEISKTFLAIERWYA